MKVSYQWLQDFVDLDIAGVEEVARSLTTIGFKVEDVEARNGDFVINVEVTTNRPDCLNHLGIARELAARFQLQLKPPDFSVPGKSPTTRQKLATSVSIEDPDLCPRYAARLITGIEIKESPDWLKERLEAVGQRPINNIVDTTNYVMLETGHPLHAFDYEKLCEHRIVVRRSRKGEKLVTLDGVARDLDPAMLAICDAKDPVALAGVMGGQPTEVSLKTGTILLESAYFQPASIRNTSRALGLRSEASFRFARGADPEMPVKALNRACRLIQNLAGGSFAGPVIDEYPNPQPQRQLTLRPERIRKVVGISIAPEVVTDVLSPLEFKLSNATAKGWTVNIPSFRVDIGVEDDLVEEVARHYGFDRIEGTYPAAVSIGAFLETRRHDRVLMDVLKGFGFFEAFNYVFTHPSREARFVNEPPLLVELSNPLTEEDTHLRSSLVPGLVEALRRNLNHGNRDVRLFESGKIFSPGKGGGIEEVQRLGLVVIGRFYHPYWDSAEHDFQFPHLKGMVRTILRNVGIEPQFEAVSDTPFLHPGMAARVTVDGAHWGVLGQLHPRLQEEYKFLQPVFVSELSLDQVYARPLPEPAYQPLPKFPSIERDLSFLVDKDVEYARIYNVLKGLNIRDLRDVQLIDLYQGPNLPTGKVSLAIRLIFANPEKTLTQEEVNRYAARIFSQLESVFSVEARA